MYIKYFLYGFLNFDLLYGLRVSGQYVYVSFASDFNTCQYCFDFVSSSFADDFLSSLSNNILDFTSFSCKVIYFDDEGY